ncbi:MAG TPA: caspase family protein, partial [Bryobacteraceae bacterium]|nr:caspase family protein [Bryobacteraceae bacterium]
MIRGVVAALACCLFGLPAQGARRALLIGVSHYVAGIGSLEGPQNDVEALHRLLVDHWGFSESGVKTLVNQAATRDAILAALDQLASQAASGDEYFIFFSGHGTSWYAPGRADPELDPSTGAIVASDGRLIFGNRDLQPRLRRIDQIANAFVIFDSCYSGSSVKSVFVGVAKYTDPDTLARNVPSTPFSFDQRLQGSFGALTIREQPYPYNNIIYLSASSRSEMAIDIPGSLIASGRYRTVDGRPHGALTDAVLAGLEGAADTNHDSKITYGELYQYVSQRVNRQWNQTPQILYAQSKSAILDDPVLASGVAPR